MAVAAEGAVVTVMVSAAGSTAGPGPGPSGMAVWTVLAVLATTTGTYVLRLRRRQV